MYIHLLMYCMYKQISLMKLTMDGIISFLSFYPFHFLVGKNPTLIDITPHTHVHGACNPSHPSSPRIDNRFPSYCPVQLCSSKSDNVATTSCMSTSYIYRHAR